MAKAILSNGTIIESPDMQSVWYAVNRARRYNAYVAEGIPAALIFGSNGKLVHSMLAGEDTAFIDAEPSVRVYFAVKRRLVDLGVDWDEFTIGEVNTLMIDGQLRRLRNLGIREYEELFSLLIKYCGYSHVLTAEIMHAVPGIKNWSMIGYKLNIQTGRA